MRRTALVILFILLAGSGVCSNSPTKEQLERLMVKGSCDQLLENVYHMLAVNELINKDDPQAGLTTRKTLVLYFEIIKEKCPNRKNQGPIRR